MAEHQLTCAGCGAQFSFHRRKKYCTPRCRPGWGYTGRDMHDGAARRQEHECRWCGVAFKPKRAGRTEYCSRDCYQERKSAYKLAHERVTFVVYRKTCRGCGKRFSSSSCAKATCSDECAKARARQEALIASIAKHKLTPRECAECEAKFVSEYGQKRRKFCSDVCGKRNAKRVARQKERARLKAAHVEPVNPFEVFERDGWKCRECGKKTPRRLRGSYNDRAPELDHIVPLACGGEHSYRNTQCLCRACNAAKSNGAGGQMRLFG